ncbi:MAG: GNAT family N-acetyltransferase [Reichenbachiella sp.]|uniref:GNAT family N-acetyltransferase n=1 Tax=Reichenbachiella sp. TaxID=2184521 RepID=UPI003262F765
MDNENTYLFESERLGFRNWKDSDLPLMSAVSADPEVMEFFPSITTTEQSKEFISRMNTMFDERGYCYFAVEEISSSRFIGFIGLCYQNYESEITPCVDIGWRLDKRFWQRGYATEGAQACLRYGFEVLKLESIKSIASLINIKSINVMKKIGMKKITEFNHPNLIEHEKLKRCACYEIHR